MTEVTVSHISPHFTYRQIKQRGKLDNFFIFKELLVQQRKTCPRRTVTMCRAYSCSVRRKSTGYNRSTEQGGLTQANNQGHFPKETCLSGNLKNEKRKSQPKRREEQGLSRAQANPESSRSTRHEALTVGKEGFSKESTHPLWLSCVLERKKICFHLPGGDWKLDSPSKQSFYFPFTFWTRDVVVHIIKSFVEWILLLHFEELHPQVLTKCKDDWYDRFQLSKMQNLSQNSMERVLCHQVKGVLSQRETVIIIPWHQVLYIAHAMDYPLNRTKLIFHICNHLIRNSLMLFFFSLPTAKQNQPKPFPVALNSLSPLP